MIEMKILDLFENFTPWEIKTLVDLGNKDWYGKKSPEEQRIAGENMSRSAKARWEKMSDEEKKEYLENSFHSKDSFRRSAETNRQTWAKKGRKGIEEHIRSSFCSPEAIRKSGESYKKFYWAMTDEERKEYNKNRLGKVRAFWTSDESEETRIELKRLGEEAWASKTPGEKLDWLSRSAHSSKSRKNAGPSISAGLKLYWMGVSEERRREIGQKILNTKFGKGSWSRRSEPTMEEYFLGAYLESLYPGMFEFNGIAGVMIGHKRPDFVSRNGKKIVVEMFGSYYHDEEEEGKRIEHFAKYGYKCVIIWDYECIPWIVKEKLDSVMRSELSGEKYIGLQSVTEGGD